MSPAKIVAAATSMILVASCTEGPQQNADSVAETSSIARAQLASPEDASLGMATLFDGNDGLTLAVEVDSISEGSHALHLHTTGDCSAIDFTSAGGHLNPLDKSHGSLNPEGQHLGDLPNLEVGTDGSGSTSVRLEGERSELLSYLFDEDGTAVVIHAGPDDYVSDPAGDAGPRIACGALTRN